jgi:hypothetical protein
MTTVGLPCVSVLEGGDEYPKLYKKPALLHPRCMTTVGLPCVSVLEGGDEYPKLYKNPALLHPFGAQRYPKQSKTPASLALVLFEFMKD